jgi:hypothetical protein
MIDMKKIIDEIVKYGTLAAFISAAVLFYLNQHKLNEIESGVKALQDFQDAQDDLNAKESIVYEWALQKLMGTEIHGLEVDDEDN